MERNRYQDYTREREELPRVDVLLMNSRGDGPWLQQAIQSVEAQSYENTGLWIIDNTDRALNIGAAWNIGVHASEAPLLLILREEDAMTADLVDTLVTFYSSGKRENPSLAHVSTFITVIDEQTGRSGSVAHPHAGLFERSTLLAHPFNEELSRGVDAELLQRLRANVTASEPITFGVAHHHGYIWRNHTFRIDRMNVQT